MCTYAHGEAELRGNLSRRRRDKPRELCRLHFEGRCPEPDVCKNAHTVYEYVAPLDSDEEEMEKRLQKKEKKLKKIMDLQQIDQEMMYYRTSMCRFSKGSCWFGNFCFYAHEKNQLRSGPDDPKGMPGTDAFDFDLSGQTAMQEMAAGIMPGVMPGMPPVPGMPPIPGMPLPLPGMPGMPGMEGRGDKSPKRDRDRGDRRDRSRSRRRDRSRSRRRDRDRDERRRMSDPGPMGMGMGMPGMGGMGMPSRPAPMPSMPPMPMPPMMGGGGIRRPRIDESDL